MPDFTLYLTAPWWNARMRKVALDDFLDALEDLEMMSRRIGGPERHRGLQRREPGQRRRRLRHEDDIAVEEAEAPPRPLLHPLDGIEMPRPLRRRAEPGSR